MRVQLAGLAVGHPDRRGEVLTESRHPEGQDVDSRVGLAVKTQRTGNSAGGVFCILSGLLFQANLEQFRSSVRATRAATHMT